MKLSTKARQANPDRVEGGTPTHLRWVNGAEAHASVKIVALALV
jgi:hypothetical protein